MMTVQQLIDELQTLDKDAIVVIQSDADGTEYSPLVGAEGNVVYLPESDWSGEVKYKTLTPDMIDEGYTEDDVYDGEDGQSCVLVWPLN